ncbi:Astacin-like metalloendopeptidase [Strongyloides ratti]|uniref:Zinc metalloproteinase n=1 Tax=Strongyloides ratti TaxID=34506 RepID=A0A090LR60_STRRB|nr:Astacin-like metalloendopeptidase [Strongyloides ratti]CEF70657.1 Astacin-like metalloendopeptidase [Strongyloides ratti]
MIFLKSIWTYIVFINVIKSKTNNQSDESRLIQEQIINDYKNTKETIKTLNKIENKIFQETNSNSLLIAENTIVQNNKKNDTTFEFEDAMENSELYEGDIMLTSSQSKHIIDVAESIAAKKNVDVSKIIKHDNNRNKRKITTLRRHKWTFPIKYYVDDFVSESLVDKGIKIIEEETCVKFTKSNGPIHGEPGLIYYYGKGCWSYVGKENDYHFQSISIGRGCQNVGVIQHETLHALGLNHEHDRVDRDSYIKIFMENVDYYEKYNFFKISPQDTSTYGIPYDYGSIMHYDTYAFSKNKQKTMVPIILIYEKTIGTIEKMSFDDIKMVNLHYCTGECYNSLTCYNGGYQDPKNCQKCRCVDGFAGKQCDEIPSHNSECPSTCYNVSPKQESIEISGMKNCIIHLRANKGEKINLIIEKAYFDYKKNVCISKNSLEIKYFEDKTTTGARFCGYDTNIQIISKNHHIVVMYSSIGINNNIKITFKKY